MLKVKINDGEELELRIINEQFVLNNHALQSDMIKIGKDKYHVLLNDKSYTIEFLAKDETGKLITIAVNGKKQTAKIEDEYDVLLKKLGMDKLMTAKANDVKAPMPGLVLKLVVKEGDAVKKGDPLLILEAMKMENIIKAGTDGVIKKINITERTAVDKNQVLMLFE